MRPTDDLESWAIRAAFTVGVLLGIVAGLVLGAL